MECQFAIYAIAVTDDVYLLAWIASARTAVPRNDGVPDVFCE